MKLLDGFFGKEPPRIKTGHCCLYINQSCNGSEGVHNPESQYDSVFDVHSLYLETIGLSSAI